MLVACWLCILKCRSIFNELSIIAPKLKWIFCIHTCNNVQMCVTAQALGHGIMGTPVPNKFSYLWSRPDGKYNSYLVIGQLSSHETNRRRVSHNNNISQLLRDSFSVSQQPPISEPPSHYSMLNSVLNVKALVDAFNQEKALVGAFSVIVQPVVEPMDWFAALVVGTLRIQQ